MTLASKPDALLTSARWLINLIVVLVGVVFLGLIGAAIALPLFEVRVLALIAEHGGKQAGSEAIVAIEILFVVFIAMLALAFRWLRQLRRIIDSVGHGDPFAPENADRLARMGWLTVAIECLSIPGGIVAGYLAHIFRRAELDVGLSLGGVLMALVLFILARVFREGAAMRDELEGTV